MTRDFSSRRRFQIAKTVDAHCFAAIVAATPPFGQTGTTSVDRVRKALLRCVRLFAPDVLVVNPTDAARLDLTAAADDDVFAIRDVGRAHRSGPSGSWRGSARAPRRPTRSTRASRREGSLDLLISGGYGAILRRQRCSDVYT